MFGAAGQRHWVTTRLFNLKCSLCFDFHVSRTCAASRWCRTSKHNISCKNRVNDGEKSVFRVRVWARPQSDALVGSYITWMQHHSFLLLWLMGVLTNPVPGGRGNGLISRCTGFSVFLLCFSCCSDGGRVVREPRGVKGHSTVVFHGFIVWLFFHFVWKIV